MAIYTESDFTAVKAQKNKRWQMLLIPIVLLGIGVIASFIARIEWVTTACVIGVGALLIAGYDFAIKPLRCYVKYLDNALHGRRHNVELPFVSLSEDISMYDGVRCRTLFCSDVDSKNRPYERMFYFDAEKEFPEVQPGDILRIVYHELAVCDVHPAE